MRLPIRLGSLLIGALLIAAGCGGGDDAGDEELIAALESTFDLDSEDLGDIDLEPRCTAEAMVDALGGAETAEEKYGITPDTVTQEGDFEVDLDEEDARRAADGIWDCGLDGAFAAGMTEAGLSQDEADCVAGNLDEAILKKVFMAEFMGDAGAELMAEADAEIGDNMLDAMAECDVDIFG